MSLLPCLSTFSHIILIFVSSTAIFRIYLNLCLSLTGHCPFVYVIANAFMQSHEVSLTIIGLGVCQCISWLVK